MHLDDQFESTNVALSLAVIAAAGFSSLTAPLLIRRELDATSLRTLALSYRSRFMLRLAFAEVVMLVGFAASKVWGPWWVVFIGAAITVVGFIRLAPTARHLQQDQDRLSLSGCQLSLTEALRTPAAVS